MTFTELAHLVAARRLPFDPNADLPRPNVYWGTARTSDGRTFNDYVAAEHTRPAMVVFLAMATVSLRMRLVKSNNVVLLRRLNLGDLLDNPEAFERALTNAQAINDHASARALERLPIELAADLGLVHEAGEATLLPLLKTSQIAPQRVLR